MVSIHGHLIRGGWEAMVMHGKTSAVVIFSVFLLAQQVAAQALAGSGLGGGPLGATVKVIAIDRQTTSTIYAGTNSGVFKTTNGGSNWIPINNGLTDQNIGALAIDPAVPSRIYAGTLGGGVFKSINGGTDWIAVNGGLPGYRPNLATPPPPANGISGTDVLGLAIDPSNPATIYAVVAETIGGTTRDLGRVYKTTNSGANWVPSNMGMEGCTLLPASINPNFGDLCTPSITGLKDTFVESLAIDPTNPSTLYAGTVPGGVFKSTNGGRNWVSINLTTAATDIEFVVADPAHSGTVYAVATGNILRSVGPGAGNLPNNQAKGTNSGIFKSTDGGRTWNAADSGLPESTSSASADGLLIYRSLAIDPLNPSILYTGVVGRSAAGLFKSTDGGVTWTSANSRLMPQVLAIDPSHSNVVYAGFGGSGVFKSANGGVSWVGSSNGLNAVRVESLVLDPRNSATVYTATSAGLFKSCDGGRSWTRLELSWNQALPGPIVHALALDPTNSETIYAGSSGEFGIFMSTDGGNGWSASTSGLRSADSVRALIIDPSDPTVVYAGTQYSGLMKSTNAGGTWSAVTSLEDTEPARGRFIQTLAIDPLTPPTIFAAIGRPSVIFKSRDRGTTWTPAGKKLAGPPLIVNVLVIDGLTPNTIYAGTSRGILKSTDSGETWSAGNSGLSSTAITVNALVIDPRDRAVLYAGTETNGVFKSNNGGQSWTPANDGLPSSIVALAIDKTDPTTLYAGTSSAGVFKSTDGCQSWQPTGSE